MSKPKILQEISDIKDVNALQNTNISSHCNDTEAHVTQSEKTDWNSAFQTVENLGTAAFKDIVVSDSDPSSSGDLPAGTIYIHTSSTESDTTMTKEVYDVDNDGIVDEAKTLSGLTVAVSDLNSVNGLLPYNEAARFNLLYNSNFTNPVNQRNGTSYTYSSSNGAQYSIDRWLLSAGSIAISENTGITLTSATLTQYLDGYSVLLGETLTFSAKIDGEVTSVTGVLSETAISNNALSFYYDTTKGYVCVNITGSGILSWAKLEIGSAVTTYVPKSYIEEFNQCKYYYYRMCPSLGRGRGNVGVGLAVTTNHMGIPLDIEMRVISPTVRYSALSHFEVCSTDSTVKTPTDITDHYGDAKSGTFTFGVKSGMWYTAGKEYVFRAANSNIGTSNTWIEFDAELY